VVKEFRSQEARGMKRKIALFAIVVLFTILCSAQDQKFANLGDFKLVSGDMIKDCRIGYRTYGQMNAVKTNVVVFPTWFGGTSEEIARYHIAPGKTIDPTKYYVIVIDALANGVSSSPSNSVQQHGVAFPKITIRDMVESQHELLTKALGLKHVHAVMGISMGGMQTFQWAVSYPEFMDVLIPIVGTPQQTSYDLLLWNTELDQIRSDPEYQGGNYKVSPPLPTVAHLHQLNMTTPENRVKEISPAQFGKFYFGQQISNDANNTVRQLEAMIGQDIAAQFGGSMEKAAEASKAKMLIVVATQDHMVNPVSAMRFAELKKAELLKLTGDCGHVAPGCEGGLMSPAVEKALESGH
jgi:homoserine O-acetyltransferase/O-succinyltransferase